MDQKTYRQLSNERLVGRLARLGASVLLVNGTEIPRGTIVEIRRKHGGLDVQLPGCQSCGVSHRLKLSPWVLDLLDEDDLAGLEPANAGAGPWL